MTFAGEPPDQPATSSVVCQRCWIEHGLANLCVHGRKQNEGHDNRKLRYRINVSTTSKGAKSFDTTVDGEGFTQDEILERSDALVAALDLRYPPPTGA